MNSIWNTNIELFKSRFPQLCNILKIPLNSPVSIDRLQVVAAKNSSPTLLYTKEDGSQVALHSKYNPEREAEQALAALSKDKEIEAALFLSPALGYSPLALAKKNPNIPIIIVEKDANWLFEAFKSLDWSPILKHPKIVILTECDSQIVLNILRQYTAEKIAVFVGNGANFYEKSFYQEILAGLEQDRQKNQVNRNTLQKFSHLWLRNSCRNLHFLAEKDGINKYTGILTKERLKLPFIILAAGPSLQKTLVYLKELKERAVLVCVDTALAACLKAGIEPDFIILVDPQYYCARHLDFLRAPSSVLILESAVWPSVFCFDCKEIVMCSSLFPIGQYFERQLGSKGKLGAGGSVATTAWDFARVCGANEIYIAGMDLGFPGKQTHIRGSQFEEKAHRLANRLRTAESTGVASLMSANPSLAKDYQGKALLTDKKMSVFAWWFEHNTAIARLDGQYTYSLSKESLAIKGIEAVSIEDFLKKPLVLKEKERFFKLAQAQSCNKGSFNSVLNSFVQNLDTLYALAKKGLSICKKALERPERYRDFFAELNAIDSKILGSECKEAAALVFPNEDKLKSLFTSTGNKERDSINYSSLIYKELIEAVREYRKYL